jgi:hypothetical protein
VLDRDDEQLLDRDDDDDDEDDEELLDSNSGGVGELLEREKILNRALILVSRKMQQNFQCSFHVGLMHFRNQNYPKAKEVRDSSQNI